MVASELGAEDKVKDGVFGAMMDVALVNDGPVTLVVDSPPREGPASSTSADATAAADDAAPAAAVS